ncbi:DUF3079 domain-containing protein [Pseudoduganella danionis]|uniref:DUF3079 domain-containing protein n=1 Tax=Pseudoduganella danionis TaxID=1890295 RepID=A0ABW9SW06_9BURK|nr:DUF3079 domain-containing protein [Pseudoduganella danionis]MTW34499.1 DUF3079 domain-containing protein [Pseudoduganella danionis]
MAKRFPIHPAKPELICWGCDKYCPADSMACGNGSDRTQHPVELFGPDWHSFGLNAQDQADEEPAAQQDEPPAPTT